MVLVDGSTASIAQSIWPAKVNPLCHRLLHAACSSEHRGGGESNGGDCCATKHGDEGSLSPPSWSIIAGLASCLKQQSGRVTGGDSSHRMMINAHHRLRQLSITHNESAACILIPCVAGAAVLAEETDHYQSEQRDSGWACGYRNCQMLLSAVLRQEVGPHPMRSFDHLDFRDWPRCFGSRYKHHKCRFSRSHVHSASTCCFSIKGQDLMSFCKGYRLVCLWLAALMSV